MMRPSYETIRRQMRFPSILQFFRPDSSSFEPFHFVSFRFISFHFVSFSASLEIFNPSVLFSESFITRKLFITRNSLLRDEFTGLFFFFSPTRCCIFTGILFRVSHLSLDFCIRIFKPPLYSRSMFHTVLQMHTELAFLPCLVSSIVLLP